MTDVRELCFRNVHLVLRRGTARRGGGGRGAWLRGHPLQRIHHFPLRGRGTPGVRQGWNGARLGRAVSYVCPLAFTLPLPHTTTVSRARACRGARRAGCLAPRPHPCTRPSLSPPPPPLSSFLLHRWTRSSETAFRAPISPCPLVYLVSLSSPPALSPHRLPPSSTLSNSHPTTTSHSHPPPIPTLSLSPPA